MNFLRSKKQVTICLCLFIVVFTLPTNSIQAESLKFTLNIPTSTEPIVIRGQQVMIVSSWIAPQTNPPAQSANLWKFEKREQRQKMLAGTVGRLTSDDFFAADLSLSRQVWISADSQKIAIRQKLWNRSQEPLFLHALVPLHCQGKQGLVLPPDYDAQNWQVLVQQRLKNGRPQTILPSDTTEYELDQFALFHKARSPNPALLIGYLSQLDHCAHMWLQFDRVKGVFQLDHFIAECEFDDVLVPPGGERTSQWVLIDADKDPNALIADFADRVGRYHGIPRPPKNAPSVFCSWYFHGPKYNEQYFHQDLAALQQDHLPFDVFLIDECWNLGRWGDFEATESWPSGMKNAADRIRALGYKPGIWTCPFLVDFDSKLAKTHPQWLLKNAEGERIIFVMNKMDHWVLDPTFPGVCDFLEETYRKLTHDWGFEYFKFDFMRAVFLPRGQKFYDPTATRLQAYRRGLEAIRRGTGPEAYISVCGGHYGGSLGIADSQRSGSDVVSIWRAKEIPKFRQNILRFWMSRLWHVDPDAMMVRKRAQRFHPDRELSLGLLTDEETKTVALNQYIGGGLVTFCEFMPELGNERKALYRHVIPSINSSSIPLDIFDPLCPTKMLTQVEPGCHDLDPWVTVAVVNWTDDSMSEYIDLNEQVCKHLRTSQFLVFEFFSQKALGIYQQSDRIDLGIIAPHSSKLLRITPWDGQNPVLAGTDLHFSGGGVEIAEWQVSGHRVKGRVKTLWKYPVKVTAAFPTNDERAFYLKSAVVGPGQEQFWIDP